MLLAWEVNDNTSPNVVFQWDKEKNNKAIKLFFPWLQKCYHVLNMPAERVTVKNLNKLQHGWTLKILC